MSERQVRAFVFDFGGVFSQSEVSQARLRAYDEILGLPADTLSTALFSGEAWELASTGQLSLEQYWERVGKTYQDRLPDEFLRFRQGIFWAEPINEAMVALARRLHADYALAICSNALPELAEILAERPDLASLFDVHVISAQVGLRKPDPRMYRLTADRLGLPIETCLLVDDKPRNTEAAQVAGMQTIVFQSVEQLEAELVSRGFLAARGMSSG